MDIKLNRKPFDTNLNNWVDGFLNDLPAVINHDLVPFEWKGIAPVNIKENENGYQVEVIAPGFEKPDFTVSLDKNILTIAAEKKEETKEENSGKQIRREYKFRSFKRSFTIDENIDATNIDASYVNGVLALNLPKKEKVKEAATEIKIK